MNILTKLQLDAYVVMAKMSRSTLGEKLDKLFMHVDIDLLLCQRQQTGYD